MDGVLNINKPEGISSFDVVRYIRKVTKIKKVGHAGTLDPAATGVLPVCLGRATKIIDYIMNDYKVYQVELKLGIVTDTYDKEGAILSEAEVTSGEDEVKEVILSFIGESYQVPPMYSALKVNGKRLYELARQGKEVEREPRKIHIYTINIESIDLPVVKFTVSCSKGTYIRSLCYDIGDKLGCGGMMSNLKRVTSSCFDISNAIELYDINEENVTEYLISIDNALSNFDKIQVDDKMAKLLCNGVFVKDRRFIAGILKEGFLRVYDSENKLIGIGMKSNDGFKIVNLLI